MTVFLSLPLFSLSPTPAFASVLVVPSGEKPIGLRYDPHTPEINLACRSGFDDSFSTMDRLVDRF